MSGRPAPDTFFNNSCIAIGMDFVMCSSLLLGKHQYNCAVDLLGHCAGYLKTSYHEILTELLHYRRSDVLLF